MLSRPWENKAKLFICLIKKAVRKYMKESDFPLAFWDYCVEFQSQINNLTVKSTFTLHGANTSTSLTGEEGGISNFCQYN